MKLLFFFLGISLLGLFPFSVVYSQRKSSDGRIPKAISFPEPIYPPEARAAEMGGEVTVKVKIDKKGQVAVERAYGPNAPCSALGDRRIELIRKAAIEAANNAVFEPPIKNGRPTDMHLELKYTFDPHPRPNSDEAPPMVESGVLTGRATFLPRPYFPTAFRGGAVPVSILFDETGRVVSAAARGGPEQFQDAAIVAACKARFEPAILNGKPVKVSGIITYSFGR